MSTMVRLPFEALQFSASQALQYRRPPRPRPTLAGGIRLHWVGLPFLWIRRIDDHVGHWDGSDLLRGAHQFFRVEILKHSVANDRLKSVSRLQESTLLLQKREHGCR